MWMENDKAPWTVAYIRMDSEPLLQSNDLKEWMKEKGIEPEHSPRYKHALNGVVERRIQSIGEAARAMMLEGSASEEEFKHAFKHASYCQNNLPTRANKGASPMEKWTGTKMKNIPKGLLKGPLFCLAYACVYAAERGKNGPRARPCIYLGCDENSRAFVVRDLSTRRVYTTADLECIKTEFPYRAKVARTIDDDEYKIPEHQFEDLEPEAEPDDEHNDAAKMDEAKTQDEGATEGTRRSRRRREPSSQALRNIAHD